MCCGAHLEATVRWSAESSRSTHQALERLGAYWLLGSLLMLALPDASAIEA